MSDKRNPKNENSKMTAVLFIVIFGVVVITIWYINNFSGTKPISEFIFSILTSIIASFGYALITGLLYEKRDTIDRFEEGLNQIRQDADRLEHVQRVMEQKIAKGILDVRKRDEYEERFWIDFLRHTNGELILSGKTLYRWIRVENIKNDFKDCLIKLLKNECKITLVMYQEVALKNSTDNNERKEFKKFLYKQILPELTGRGKEKREKMKAALSEKLIIRETKNLSYLYIYNGEKVIAMHYFKNMGNDNNLMFVMDAMSQAGKLYQQDFSKAMSNMRRNNWINEYKLN